MENKSVVGIVAIILGLIIMIFPFVSQFVLSIIAGIGILILGIYYIILGSNLWSISKGSSIAHVILGIFGIIVGIILLGNILIFDLLVGLYLYIVGFMLLLSGIVGLFTRSIMMTKASAALMALLGIITIILGYFALLSPIYVSIILGISLLIDGIAIAMGNFDQVDDFDQLDD
ncbi:MAG: DUF308 domain-containing protein [Methanobrevibacter arboriphilus]|uniref:DUF308 domain-containing protein n=1 Tax=Methanobrevibacter arboriphilus TaxID=39441 RepID=A0A843AQG1_METAZ|nr:DUF308 domain-containing protein [Methanobrevibacter arboriphilus]MBF4469738.1 DUF308 domain-containing protein [Methanobrevibacter arboriphilus]MCC7561924.1 DUF308 domain-containing protein [Methanobrevibacter arboriphilus]